MEQEFHHHGDLSQRQASLARAPWWSLGDSNQLITTLLIDLSTPDRQSKGDEPRNLAGGLLALKCGFNDPFRR